MEDEYTLAGAFCPILNNECVGRKCAMAVKIGSATLRRPHEAIWLCGLVSTDMVINHGNAQVVEHLWSKDQYGLSDGSYIS